MDEILNILYINIRSLRNKVDDLMEIVNKHDFEIHIIALTETWIYPNEVEYFNIPNYNVVHHCRDSRGGGVSLFIKDNLEYDQRHIREMEIEDCNILCVCLTKVNCVIINIYRAPRNKADVFLAQIDKIMETQKSPCIILGDMNLNLLSETDTIREYRNIIEMNTFTIQNILTTENATRQTEKTATILDHVLMNKNLYCDITLTDHVISDHKVMYIKLNKVIEKKTKEVINKTKLLKGKWKELIQVKLQQEEITSFGKLAEIITKTKIECTKESRIKVSNNNYWINAEFIEKIKQRDNSYKRWKLIRNSETERHFKNLKNVVNNMRRKLKKEYVEKTLNEAGTNSKKMWRVLNDICLKRTKKKGKMGQMKSMTGAVIEDEQQIAEEFNTYFSEIGKNLASKIKPVLNHQFREEETKESIYLEPTDLTEINSIIRDLNNNSSPGEDGITKSDIVLLFEVLGDKIVNIINDILVTGLFPNELKTAKISPIHKKGAKTELGNYRPISILNIFSKITEKVIKHRLTNFIQKFFNIDPYQYGFQKKSSTLGATGDLLEYITEELDKKRYVLTVFIDLQKAFDTVDIDILLNKLEKMGMRGIAKDLFQSYSKDRKHYTQINKTKSKKKA